MRAFQRRVLLVAIAILFALSGCTPAAGSLAGRLLGRWQRIGEGYLPEPYISAEHVEFRPDGQLIELLWDAGPQQAWTIAVAHYAISSNGHVEFNGYCWRGWERYPCTHTYAVARTGDTLRIIDIQDQNRVVQYRRIADLEPEPPPTLVPPFASPTPAS